MEIFVAVLILGILGTIMGGFLAFAAKKFEVKLEPKIEELNSVLPGINCGACGYPGCGGYAKAIYNGEAPINYCSPGGEGVQHKIAQIMGLEVLEMGAKKTARIMCKGDNTKTNKKYIFDVETKTCANASLYFSGDKSCSYGCMGYGDCERVCPYDAIYINKKGIAVVDEKKCTACGKCIEHCPKHIIKIIPYSNKFAVFCSSKDKGTIARKLCTVSCIGCGICLRNCPVEAITMENNLAVIDGEKCINCGICELKCPTNAIVSDIKEIKKAIIVDEKCIGCTMCKKVCPVDAIDGEVKQKHKVNREICVGCGLCEAKCPVDAIYMETEVKKD